MTNEECQMTKKARNPNDKLAALKPPRCLRPSLAPEQHGFRASCFVSDLSFVIRHSSLFLCAVALLIAVPVTRAADTNAVLDAWLSAQTNFTTWSADFVQTRSLKALSQPLVTTGQVWFAKPNSFHWELGKPAQTVAVRDADLLEVIYPKLKRVERYSLAEGKSGQLGEALGLLDAGFPKSRADFDARFRLLSLQATNEAWLLELQPINPSARRMMPAIRVTVATNNFVLLGNELFFPDGSRMRNDFSNAKLNETFASDIFRPSVGADFKVVEPSTR